MKKVIIIDTHTLFREFLKQKLSDDQIEVIISQENRDPFTKVISLQPDLIILDTDEDDEYEMEFLQKNAENTNTAPIPVIITGNKRGRTEIASLAKYGVVKYFEKPIQFDLFFESIGNVLHTPVSMDTTPCVLDLHRNGHIVFIELALGLNREKIALLQFKLSEMIEKEKIEVPKVIIMLTNLELSFVDGYNLEFLIDNVLACPKVRAKDVKILSLSPFVKELLEGHHNYSEIEMASNLPKLLNTLVDTSSSNDVSDLITDKILVSSDANSDSGSVDTRFSSDLKVKIKDRDGSVFKIAIIDSNIAAVEQTKQIFVQSGADCFTFSTGQSFLSSYEDNKFDLIVLDVLLSDKTGLSLLAALQQKPRCPPVIVYSPSLQKDVIVKILSLGAKSFILKPQKPEVLLQKCLSLLKETK